MPAEEIKQATNVWDFLSKGWPYAYAIASLWFAHLLTQRREKRAQREKKLSEQAAAEEKRQTDLRFISVEIIFMLEEFAQRCADVSQDYGEPDRDGYHIAVFPSPDISFTGVKGDWKSLPPQLMYAVLELPVLRQDAVLRIGNETTHMSHPPEDRPSKEVRQKHFALLGYRACVLACRLRLLSGFPASELASGEWSAMPVMRNVLRRETSKRIAELRALDDPDSYVI